MQGDPPLNGCDYLMLGFDYELRRHGYTGNSCQIILELASAISPEALRKRLAELVQRHPILCARPGGWLTPKWMLPSAAQFAASVPLVPSVRLHRDESGLREKLSDEPLAIHRGELFRFDLIERDGGRMDVVFTWAHVLMDANSAEHFLAVVGREDVALPATNPVLPPRLKRSLKERLLLAKKRVDQLTEFCKAAPRTVGVRHPKAARVQRYRVEKFSAEETARVRANGAKLCGALAGAQFHASAAMMELHRLHQLVGCPTPSYVLPMPVSLRPKGSVEPVFSNHLAMLMVQLLPEQLASTDQAVVALKAQTAKALRDGLLESGLVMMDFSRILPLPVYLYVLKRHGLQGEICSFFYGDTAAVTPLLTTFFGATIQDFTHVGATTPSPGIGAIFYCFRGALRLTIFYLETHFSSDEAAEFASNLRTRLLHP